MDTTQYPQKDLGLDDGSGLRVVKAQFESESKFTWELFDGFEELRVLTYSASAKAIVRMLDEHSFDYFECVFGYEGVLGDTKRILAFQKSVVDQTLVAIRGLKDERHKRILEIVAKKKAHFRVLRTHTAHAKIYLLSTQAGRTRVVVGSANLSERAFSGDQPEAIVMFDNDHNAWKHYTRIYESIRNTATDAIELPPENVKKADIKISEVPIVNTPGELIVHTPSAPTVEFAPQTAVERVDKVFAELPSNTSSVLPPARNGKIRLTGDIKRELTRLEFVKSSDQADSRNLSIDRVNRKVYLSEEPFPLDWDVTAARKDADLIVDYFSNYDEFDGDVEGLKRDYFALAAWLFFAPFMCDMRSLALARGEDVIHYPAFGIVFGKSNCGKTSLVDTLMTAMFGFSKTVDKRHFTTSNLRALQQTYKRFPVVFDDLSKKAFNAHGKDTIKDELTPPVEEYPCFVLSMNADRQSFPDEVVKRCMMIFTTAALPVFEETKRKNLQKRVQQIRGEFTGHLYRRYLAEVIDLLGDEPLPEDWLALSSQVLSELLSEAMVADTPLWINPLTWDAYAITRHDRIRMSLTDLLRISSYSKVEQETPNGWTVEDGRVIVWEQQDAFGRRAFNWDDVPSTLIDEVASSGNRTVLHRVPLEKFIGQSIGSPKSFWTKLMQQRRG